MDPFGDLLGMSSTPSPAPAPSGFSFLSPAPAPPPPSGFSFLSPPGVSGNTSQPTQDADILNFASVSSGIDVSAAMAAAGLTARDNAALAAPLHTTSTVRTRMVVGPDTDFTSWSAGQLKEYLKSNDVPLSGCVEKADFISLAVTTSRNAHARATGSATGASASALKAKSAVELGLPNAFALHGLSNASASVAASTLEFERERERETARSAYLNAAGGVAATAESFLQVVKRMPLRGVLVPNAPPPSLFKSVRLPRVCFSPVLSELHPSGLVACHTELTSTAAAAVLLNASSGGSGAVSAAQAKLLPFVAGTCVGPRRYFEMPLRYDVSDAAVLASLAAAAAACGMDATHTSPRSAVLSQRVSVPYAAFTAFTASPACTGLMQKEGGATRFPVQIHETAAAAGSAGTTAGWLVGALTNTHTQVYTNSITVCIGTNARHERVAAVVAARYTTPDAPAAAAAAAVRVLHKDRVGGAVVKLGSGDAAAPAAAAGGGGGLSSFFGGGGAAPATKTSSHLSDLVTVGGGIACVLVSPQPVDAGEYSYRTAAGSDAAAAATPAPTVDTLSDVFGMSTPAAATAGTPTVRLTGVPAIDTVLSIPAMPVDIRHDTTAAKAPRELVDALLSSGVEAASTALPGFDDASVGTPLGAAPPVMHEWSRLRVHFLDVDMKKAVAAPAAPAPRAAPAAGGDIVSLAAASAPSGHTSSASGAGSFDLAQVGDELVSLTCELTSALRSRCVLAESVWPDALKYARIAVARERGEVLEDTDGTSVGGGDVSFLTASAGFSRNAAPGGASKLSSAGPALASSGASGAHDPFAASERSLVSVDKIFHTLDATSVANAPPTAAAAPSAAAAPVQQMLSVPSSGPASGAPAAADTRGPAFSLHADAMGAIRAGYRMDAEARLYKAAIQYEARAKLDEAVLNAVTRALAPTYAALKLEPRPRAAPVALEEMALEEGDPCPDSVAPPLIDASAGEPLLPADPPALTPMEATMREIYIRAYTYLRYAAWSALVQRLQRARDADVEMRSRLLRKRKHVLLRCSAAFYSCLDWLSQLHETTSAPYSPPPGPVADAQKALSTNVGVGAEGVVAVIPGASGGIYGDLIVTLSRVAFTSNVLGFKSTRNMPWNVIVSLSRSTSMMMTDSALTITHVDPTKTAAKAAAKPRAASGAISKAAAPVKSSGEEDIFAQLSSSAPSAGRGGATAGGPTSIADAFDDMCDVPAPAVAPSVPVAAPAFAPAPAAPVKAAGGMEGLDEEDMMIFMTAGGATDTLSQLTFTPSSVDRDNVLCLLLLLRQLDIKPRVRCLAFGRRIQTSSAGKQPQLLADDEVADFADVIRAQDGTRVPAATELPLVLRLLREHGSLQSLAASAAAVKAKPAADAAARNQDIAGLFDLPSAAPPASAPTAAAAAASGKKQATAANAYPDLAAAMSLGDI